MQKLKHFHEEKWAEHQTHVFANEKVLKVSDFHICFVF